MMEVGDENTWFTECLPFYNGEKKKISQEAINKRLKMYVHIPEHTRSLSGSLLGYKTIP